MTGDSDTSNEEERREDDFTVLELLDHIAKILLIIIVKSLEVVSAVAVPFVVLLILGFVENTIYVPTIIIDSPTQQYAIPLTWIVAAVALSVMFSRLLRLLLNRWPSAMAKELYGQDGENREKREQ